MGFLALKQRLLVCHISDMVMNVLPNIDRAICFLEHKGLPEGNFVDNIYRNELLHCFCYLYDAQKMILVQLKRHLL